MIYTLNYTVPVTKEFKVNIDDLAKLIFEDFVSDGYAPDLYWMLTYFGDNILIFLCNLGFPGEEIELDDTKLDEICDDILPDLEISLNKLIEEYETNNNRTNDN